MRLITQIGTLARRGFLAGFLRQPANVIPSILFPLMFLGLMVGGAGRAAEIPGFPAQGYLEFMLPAALVQGTMLLGINAGAGVALDIEEGFIRRLLLTPVQRPALLAGHIGAVTVAGAMTAMLILGVSVLFGADIATGFLGAVAVVAFSVLVSFAFGTIGAFIGARTGSAEATQTVFPLFFIVMVFSSFFMPLDFIDIPWFEAVARANPITYVIDAVRGPVTTGWSARDMLLGLAAVAGVSTVGLLSAARAMRRRVAQAI